VHVFVCMYVCVVCVCVCVCLCVCGGECSGIWIWGESLKGPLLLPALSEFSSANDRKTCSSRAGRAREMNRLTICFLFDSGSLGVSYHWFGLLGAERRGGCMLLRVPVICHHVTGVQKVIKT
jgi:hypothetical protein